jgi:hypothetical protein
MLFFLLIICLSLALASNVKGIREGRGSKDSQCAGENYLLVQALYNNSDIDSVCAMYGMRPAQITFDNFQAALDDLSDCIVGGIKRAQTSMQDIDEENSAWIGGIEGYGNCVTLDLLGSIIWNTNCDDIQRMVVCQVWDVGVYTTITYTTTVCPPPPPTPSTTLRTQITLEFSGRLELDIWQINKSAPINKLSKDSGACGANGVLILANSSGYLDSRTACQNSNSRLTQLDLTPSNYPILQQVVDACLGTNSTNVWVNSYNGLGIVNNDSNAPCGYAFVSPGDPELVLLNDEGTCGLVNHWVACQTNLPTVTSIGPAPITGTTYITSYETVIITAAGC